MFRLIFVAAQIAGIALVAHAEPMRIEITPIDQNILPQPNQEQLECLAKNIYFEARNQSDEAMAAIGYATINRVASENFPDTICDVVTQGPLDGSDISKHRCQFSWYCDGKADVAPVDDTYPEVFAWDRAQLIAELVYWNEIDDPTDGSTYYHADYVEPFWIASFEFKTVVDNHLFYTYK